MAENTNVYDDKITEDDLSNLSTEQQTAIDNSNALYDDAIKNVDSYITNQQAYIDKWKKEQTNIQNEQTDFTIKQINQQKDQARSDYLKEQSGAYKDWQKQINPYGANAEAMAAQGLHHSGVSESAQVAYYNTYQNRVATAREGFQRARLNYENAITQAQLANSSALAEIALAALEKESELALATVMYKNPLITEKAQAARSISNDYWSRYKDMLSQINSQNAYELDLAKFEYATAQDAKSNSGGGSKGGVQIPKYKSAKSIKSPKLTKSSKSGATIKTKAKGVSDKSDNKTTVDMKSVLNLGYGPISPKKLNTLVKEGKAKETLKNGKLLYSKRFNY